ncbi:uncharacterized protein B0H18DRAFT_254231 [Fomitopsis serialis]|uniref:uncharacterized protein n=1 Tax=Fomitopsis serialis TaxID=139415 RepID=UPI002007CAF6|nr:uncharacterized protein B0H18DRAFT_254231 [Neoantrodia serialis]KAH9928304.1 hypothetical protein B0H18DRAFT_254231 [Neoantrodia serialis]
MYSSPSYGSPPAELSNNPFIDHPANALNRYPDINAVNNATGSSGQYGQWTQQQPSSSFAPTPAGYQGQTYSGGYQQPLLAQPTGWNPGAGYGQQQGYGSPPQGQQMSGFQPTSSFGQQLASHVNTAYTGLPQQQQQQQPPPQYGGYPAGQQQPQFGAGYQPSYSQQQQTPSYLAEFDPYAQGGGQQQQQQQPAYGGAPAGGGVQYGGRPPHPREYVQQHKQELETWDTYAWKQVQNSFDVLKEAWGQRKHEIEGRVRSMGGAGLFNGAQGYGGYYGGPQQEAARLEQLARQAETNFDSVAASSFQMHEVFTGYRQSGDLASKRRVREAINAALTSLPDWPPQTY